MTTENDYSLAGEPQDLGQDVQLFLDSDSYADRRDVVRRVNEPATHTSPAPEPSTQSARTTALRPTSQMVRLATFRSSS